MSMQYQGYVDLAGTRIYVTGANPNLTRAPILPDTVWGAAWKVNYATGRREAGFDIDFPWYTSYTSIINGKCIDPESRKVLFDSVVDNGGIKASFTDCACSSISFSADALSNSPVTCNASFVAKNGTPSAHTDSLVSPPASTGQNAPVPSYAVTCALSGGLVVPSTAVVRVNFTVEHNPFKLFTLNGSEAAQDIQEGYMVVTGTVTYYSAAAGAGTGDATNATMTIGGALGYTLPSCIIKQDGNPIDGPSNKPMRVLQFEAIGTSSSTPPIYVS